MPTNPTRDSVLNCVTVCVVSSIECHHLVSIDKCSRDDAIGTERCSTGFESSQPCDLDLDLYRPRVKPRPRCPDVGPPNLLMLLVQSFMAYLVA